MKKLFVGLTLLTSMSSFAEVGQFRSGQVQIDVGNVQEIKIDKINLEDFKPAIFPGDDQYTGSPEEQPQAKIGNTSYTVTQAVLYTKTNKGMLLAEAGDEVEYDTEKKSFPNFINLKNNTTGEYAMLTFDKEKTVVKFRGKKLEVARPQKY
jgi:hypothetical protein